MRLKNVFQLYQGILVALLSSSPVWVCLVSQRLRQKEKSKEIGVRKALGASSNSIVRLLSNEFNKMVGLAVLIALPLSYYLVSNWLEGFAYQIVLEVWYFLGAGLAALLIAWITVGLQTLKAARINPSQSLRSE